MTHNPWLTIIGIHEDGIDGLSSQAVISLERADVIMAPPRHLEHVKNLSAELVSWPIPYKDGLDLLLSFSGRNVVVLASGDPFFFGAGGPVSVRLSPEEWQSIPAPSSFALIASALGWRLEDTCCLGVHALPFETIRTSLQPDSRLILLLKDSNSLAELGTFLSDHGYQDSICHIFSALKLTENTPLTCTAGTLRDQQADAPVCVGIELSQASPSAISLNSGRPDSLFAHDGQITKQPIRALSLSALAPLAGQHLWDIGSGSGSIALEWMMASPRQTAQAVEIRQDRAEQIRKNARAFGFDKPQGRFSVHCGDVLELMDNLDRPDAVFIGGGLSQPLLDRLWDHLAPGCRIVANAVTVESEALLISAQKRWGGAILRIELSQLKQLGSKQGWDAHYPIVQWTAVR